MVAGYQGDWYQPFFSTSLPTLQPAGTTLPRKGKIRPRFQSWAAWGQAKPRLCPRCLTVISQGTSADKEKEGDFISVRVAYSMAQPRFSSPLVNSLFHHQRRDLEWENPEPWFKWDCCMVWHTSLWKPLGWLSSWLVALEAWCSVCRGFLALG